MNATLARTLIVDPVCDWMEGFGIPSGADARRLLLAIAGQESGFLTRTQNLAGPARGYWQFEKNGGVWGVLNHSRIAPLARQVCHALGVPPNVEAVYATLATQDHLACAFARLLLRADPKPVPLGIAAGWDCYVRSWRPGKPHRDRWDDAWRQAVEAMGAET